MTSEAHHLWDTCAALLRAQVSDLVWHIGPHPYEVTAELDVTTGAYEYADGVSIWFSGSYYECVDVGDPGQRCFKVVAFNASGDARPSNIACGSPP